MVAINPGSWLTNFIPIQQAWAEVGTGSMMKAARDTLRNYIKNDGFVDSSTFLTNRVGSEALTKTTQRKVSDMLGSPMEWIDQFTSNVVTRAKYYENMKNGMDAQSALEGADSWAASVMADRSKGALPTFFERKNPLTRALSMYQLEVNNQLRHLFKDIPRGAAEEGGKALLLILVKYLIGAKLFNDLFEQLVGRRPALDPLGIANEAIGGMTGYALPNVVDGIQGLFAGEGADIFKTEQKGAVQAVAGLGENLAQELPFVGGLLGGGRIPVSSALPDVGNLSSNITGLFSGEANSDKALQNIGKELAKPLYYLVPPFGGGQLKKVIEGAQVIAEGGRYTLDNEGNRKLQYDATNLSPLETIQALTFGPTSLPTAREWIESGFKTQSVKYTTAHDAARDYGIDMDVFDGWWNTQKDIKADKNANGTTIAGSKKANTVAAVNALDISDAQKIFLLNLNSGGYEFGKEMFQAKQAGISDDILLFWWQYKDTIRGDVSEKGQTVAGSRQNKLVAVVNELPLTIEQKMVLLMAAGVDAG